MKKLIFILVALFLSSLIITSYVFAAQRTQGGTFTYTLDSEPATLNPFTASDAYAQTVHNYIFEGFLTRNPDTWEFEPALAEKWELSKDKKTVTFTLKEGLKFSDGKPVTTDDVKFSFDAIKDVKYKAIVHKQYLEGVEKIEVIDTRTVKFTMKDQKYKNFDYLSGGILTILPKHVYSEPNGKYSRIAVGTGPYMIESFEKGKRLVLKRNPHYWGIEQNKKDGENNFDKVILRFVETPNVQMEMLKKKDIDYLLLRPEFFMRNAEGPEWGKNLFKVKTSNKSPKGYNYVAWNLRNPLLSDRTTRVALAHLMNRKLMLEKFRFGIGELTPGPIPNGTDYSPNNSAIEFDPKKALKLLNEVGWSDADKNGILEKTINGKKVEFKFTILMPTVEWEKYLTVYKEDAKKIGVDITIKNMEWNAYLKILDENKFDAFIMGIGGGDIDQDMGLRQLWHTSSQEKGGFNRGGYSNKKVDELIEKANIEWDRSKRIKLCKEAAEIISDEAPYLFMFNSNVTLYAHTDKVEKPKDTFKYAIGIGYWWTKGN